MTKRPGITLIELLLAIGLALVLSGIVLPAVFTGLRERAFESTVEVVRNQLLLARAHAQLTRRPVEVMYDDRPPRTARVWAQYFQVDQEQGRDQDQETLPEPRQSESRRRTVWYWDCRPSTRMIGPRSTPGCARCRITWRRVAPPR